MKRILRKILCFIGLHDSNIPYAHGNWPGHTCRYCKRRIPGLFE